jgi:hypothetical protein
MATVVAGGSAFSRSYTSLEILFGGQYKVDHSVLLGLAAGIAMLPPMLRAIRQDPTAALRVE